MNKFKKVNIMSKSDKPTNMQELFDKFCENNNIEKHLLDFVDKCYENKKMGKKSDL